MAKIPVLTGLLLQLLHMLAEVSGQSPCPEYFTYVSDPSTDKILGQIQIPSPPKNVQLHLKVGLSIAVALPTRYVGRLELAVTKEVAVQEVQRGRPLKYYIHFPLSHPVPLLTGIWFNNQLYCTGPRAAGSVVTSIMLEHTLYPPQVLPVYPDVYSPDIQPIQDPLLEVTTSRPVYVIPTIQQTTRRPSKKKPTVRPTIRTTTERINLSNGINDNPFISFPNPSTQNFPQYPPQNPPRYPPQNPPRYPPQSPPRYPPQSPPRYPPQSPRYPPYVPPRNEGNCGIITTNFKINPLIVSGMKTSPGQWPWLVAMFLVKLRYEFQCAGSLLTTRHVITAAHCCKLDSETNTNLPPNIMVVSIGRYQLRQWEEEGSVNSDVLSYVVHPDYRHEGNGDSDLAILLLKDPVVYSPTIKPICLWTGSTNLQSVINTTGYVVGWGRDESGQPYVTEPRMAEVPIVSQEDCLWSDQRFIAFTSNRTFCGGERDGSGPCNGDSGSGLMIQDHVSGRYQLRGIVSRSLLEPRLRTCDLLNFVIYVDIAKYIPWINQQISIT